MTDLRPDIRSCPLDVLILNHKVANMAKLHCYLRYNRNTPPLNGKCASSSCTTNCVCLKLKKPCRPSKRCCPTYSGKIMSFYGLQPTVFTFFYSTANPSPPTHPTPLPHKQYPIPDPMIFGNTQSVSDFFQNHRLFQKSSFLT